MWRTEPWLKAEVPGTKKARVLEKPGLAASMLKRAGRVLMIVGHRVSEALSSRPVSDYVADIAEALNAHIATTSLAYRSFRERGLTVAWLSPIEAAHRVTDPDWMGLDGKGCYKAVVVMGLPYYMSWLIFSGLKNFAMNVRTVSLDRFYQPHASWSLRNLTTEEWEKFLDELVEKLKA
ncbi:CO dehydrogenase/acetyl-CoA synthase complex subunit epsilon [Candidatus Bathyarchaeota archaeon]|nr:MAG: CO dehydrogenase/acetyl-CoA synthase complex subunit epsilon [Candidatus Bathyarchaeota archaeon]